MTSKITNLKTRPVYEYVPASESALAVDGMYVADTNAFAVEDVDSGDCLFLFYGGQDEISGFDLLPSATDMKGSYRNDLFSTAIYLPFNSRPIGTVTFLPVATRHSRMLFTLHFDEETTGCHVFGAMQMWFRDTDDLRTEFYRTQQLLLNKHLICKNANVVIAFTIEIPTVHVIGYPTDMVDDIWRMESFKAGLRSRLPVEIIVEHTDVYENSDFDSMTVHGYLVDLATYDQYTRGNVRIQKQLNEEVSEEQCGVRLRDDAEPPANTSTFQPQRYVYKNNEEPPVDVTVVLIDHTDYQQLYLQGAGRQHRTGTGDSPSAPGPPPYEEV
ncbi:hypothetical protein J6590_107466 [Homalodisca vitripennis]|nr:hypothetical protein J6590_107466 [Homalodisca vitripennis]